MRVHACMGLHTEYFTGKRYDHFSPCFCSFTGTLELSSYRWPVAEYSNSLLLLLGPAPAALLPVPGIAGAVSSHSWQPEPRGMQSVPHLVQC